MTRNALVVRGGWAGHEPVETTDFFIPFLQQHDFSIVIDESPQVYADADRMAGVDLILQAVTMVTIDAEAVAGLIAAVRAGTGLVGWHGGIVDSFRDSADYLQLVGGQFAHHASVHPPQQSTGAPGDHDQEHTVEFTELGRSHPVTEGLQDFSLTTEQYWVLSDAYNEVLATTTQAKRDFDAWDRPVTFPAVWTRHWGDGRIVVTTAGHGLETVQHPSVRRIIEQGLLWAARGAQPRGKE
ncbi:ThuA domain-containing protein [uncultured Amnibacterium sp.]|uniref:ThuA domain-containing protein n=1 Tax=uncultured Amnibacterium sp. TaxID=1631851 RepID=UPI0035CB5AEB